MANTIDKSIYNSKDLVEIQPEYAYLTIPADYVCLYHKLLGYLADYGKTMLDDCSAYCKNGSKNILTCWSMFQSAIAARTLGRTKEAELFITYIEKQLESLYGEFKTGYTFSNPIAVTSDGRLKAIVSCVNDTKFYVDVETGKLYEEYTVDKTEYKLNDSHMFAEFNNED